MGLKFSVSTGGQRGMGALKYLAKVVKVNALMLVLR